MLKEEIKLHKEENDGTVGAAEMEFHGSFLWELPSPRERIGVVYGKF